MQYNKDNDRVFMTDDNPDLAWPNAPNDHHRPPNEPVNDLRRPGAAAFNAGTSQPPSAGIYSGRTTSHPSRETSFNKGTSCSPPGPEFSSISFKPPRKIKQFFDDHDTYVFKPLPRGRANTWNGRQHASDPVSEAVGADRGDCQPIDPERNRNISNKSIALACKKVMPHRNAWGSLSYADLISKAIESSVDQRLTLAQIYAWMVQNIQYFSDKGDSTSSAGWKNSIRHNLSLHNQFKRMPNECAGKSSWWVLNEEARIVHSPRMRTDCMNQKDQPHDYAREQQNASCSSSEDRQDDLMSLAGNRCRTQSFRSTVSWDETANRRNWDVPQDRLYSLSSQGGPRQDISMRRSSSVSGIGGAACFSPVQIESDSNAACVADEWTGEDQACCIVKQENDITTTTQEKNPKMFQAGVDSVVMKSAPEVSPGMAFIYEMRLRASQDRKRHSSSVQGDSSCFSRNVFDNYSRDPAVVSHLGSHTLQNKIPEDAFEPIESGHRRSSQQHSRQEKLRQLDEFGEPSPNQFQYLLKMSRNTAESTHLISDRQAFIRLLQQKPHLKAKVQQLLAEKCKQRDYELVQRTPRQSQQLQHWNRPRRQKEEEYPELSSGGFQRMLMDVSACNSNGYVLTHLLTTSSSFTQAITLGDELTAKRDLIKVSTTRDPIQNTPDVDLTTKRNSELAVKCACDSNTRLSNCDTTHLDIDAPAHSNIDATTHLDIDATTHLDINVDTHSDVDANVDSTASGSRVTEAPAYGSTESDFQVDLQLSIDFDCDIEQVINYGNLFLDEYVDFESLKLHTPSSSEQGHEDFLKNQNLGES